MRILILSAAAVALTLAACQPSVEAPENMVANEGVPLNATDNVTDPGPDAPIGALIDPASPDAATELANNYGKAIAERRFADAYAMWGDGGKAGGKTAKEFAAKFDGLSDVALNLGAPGDPEGAAGSVYLGIKANISGRDRKGKPFEVAGPVVLRRVNNVDGSTEDQRRWHIADAPFPPDARE